MGKAADFGASFLLCTEEAMLMVVTISIDLAGVAAILTSIAAILTAIVKINKLKCRR